MHSNDTIQNELKALNSMLAGISNKNVYTVPDGYFDVLSHDILMQENISPEMDLHSVPAGYFDGLADNIMGRIRAAEDEESTILAGLKDINVYRVPPGYFEGLASSIVSKVEVEEMEDSAILAGLKDINVYRVPPGYFEGLAGSIVSKVEVEEMEDSAILAGLKDINVYRVPPGYFDNLATNIVSNIPQPAKVITMERRISVFRYAAAAVITGIIGLSVISVFNKKQTENYVASNTEVMDKAKKIISENSFDAELSTVSDEAIVNYLKESGEDVNAALVASVADDKNLPDQVDYMTDDKTLDNLLDELKTNN